MIPTPAAPTSPWRSGRWVFGAIWLFFIVYPAIGIVQADVSVPAKVGGFVLLGVFVGIYLLLCVYAMWEPQRGPWWRSPTVGALILLLACTAGLIPILHGGAFALSPYLMAVTAFAIPVGPAVSLAGIMAIIIAAIAIPELFGWELDTGFLVVVAVVAVTMMVSRLARDGQREREVAAQRQRELDAQLAVVNERERVARDVHDILGHSLTVISVKTELAGRLIDLDPDRAKTELAEVNSLAREALAEVRATVGDLRTPELPSVLAAAASALDAAGIAADLPDPALLDHGAASPHSTLFAWVLREAVTNVVRHSGATHCCVTITDHAIRIGDDGRGSAMLSFGNGLRGLSERVETAGGRLVVRSDASGTELIADMAG